MVFGASHSYTAKQLLQIRKYTEKTLNHVWKKPFFFLLSLSSVISLVHVFVYSHCIVVVWALKKAPAHLIVMAHNKIYLFNRLREGAWDWKFVPHFGDKTSDRFVRGSTFLLYYKEINSIQKCFIRYTERIIKTRGLSKYNVFFLIAFFLLCFMVKLNSSICVPHSIDKAHLKWKTMR